MSVRVIRIFDRRRIAINIGAADGVKPEEKLLIYTPDDDIVDPQTGQSLGTYRRLKATVYVKEVFENFCVASPPQRREEVPIPTPPESGISGIFAPRRTETRLVPGQLNVANSELDPLPSGDQVHVGDIVEREPATVPQG